MANFQYNNGRKLERERAVALLTNLRDNARLLAFVAFQRLDYKAVDQFSAEASAYEQAIYHLTTPSDPPEPVSEGSRKLLDSLFVEE